METRLISIDKAGRWTIQVDGSDQELVELIHSLIETSKNGPNREASLVLLNQFLSMYVCSLDGRPQANRNELALIENLIVGQLLDSELAKRLVSAPVG